MSFRLKTILGIAAIEAVLLAILIGSSLHYLRASNEEELTKRAATAARLFASTTRDAVLATDLALLESAVREVLSNPGIEYARVRGRGDRVLAEGGRDELLRRPFVADAGYDSDDDGTIDAAVDIEVAGVRYGRVEIGLATGALADVVDAARRRAALIAGLEMILVALFSFALGSYLTRGLSRLQQASRRIAGGDLGFRLEARGGDELADTARAFNEMSTRLAEAAAERDRAEAELGRYRDHLEQLVASRTAELTQANEDLRETNRRLADTRNRLLESERMAGLGQLAGGVAHEINNPIAFVGANLGSLEAYLRGLLALIEDEERLGSHLPAAERERWLARRREAELDYVKTDAVALLEESRDGLVRVGKIVQDLRDFAGPGDASWQAADLHRGLESTLNLLAGRLGSVEVVREYGRLPEVQCLPSEINQVFMNLLVNAIQAMTGQGRIILRTGVDEGGAWVEMADTGPGIPPEIISRIFDPFFTTRPVGDGTGLGLSLAYGIVQRHRGRLEAGNLPGGGARFRLWLPLAQPEAAAD